MAAAAAILAAIVCGSALAKADFHFKEFAQGGRVVFSDCPFGDEPPTVAICTDYVVWYARFDAALDGGPVDRARQPFVAVVEIIRFDTSTLELISIQLAESTAVVGSYDKAHLRSASIVSTEPMILRDVDLATGDLTPTGSVVTVGPLQWTGTSDVMTFGNDGPASADQGLGHVGGRCETANYNAHQRFRFAEVTGAPPSIDGVVVSAPYRDQGAIFNNWFHIVEVSKNCP